MCVYIDSCTTFTFIVSHFCFQSVSMCVSVLLCKYMQVADFGLAKLSQDNYTHVSTRVMGTFG